MKKKIKKEKPDFSYRIEKTAAFWMFIHPNIYVIEDYLEYINLSILDYGKYMVETMVLKEYHSYPQIFYNFSIHEIDQLYQSLTFDFITDINNENVNALNQRYIAILSSVSNDVPGLIKRLNGLEKMHPKFKTDNSRHYDTVLFSIPRGLTTPYIYSPFY